MTIENININDDFKVFGGHDKPPKKKTIKENEENEETKIPFSENDVIGLTFIQED